MANNDLINRTHCKEFALRIAQEMRQGWKPNRVSDKEFLDDLNTRVRNIITKSVMHHPTVGKTINQIYPLI